MLQTTAQRFGSTGKSFVSPSAAAAVLGAALLASGTTDDAETAWSPSAACLLPDVLPVAGTLLSYGGDRQLAAGGTVTHSGALTIGANALTCGAITASGAIQQTGSLGNWVITSTGAEMEFSRNSVNYIRATGASASLNFGTGGVDGRLVIASTGSVTASGAVSATYYTASNSGAGFGYRLSGNCSLHASAGVTTLRSYSGNDILLVDDDRLRVSAPIQDTPTQSALDPTATNIPSGKRQGWYNSTLSEFRDWVNIGGTLLKSAAYT